MSARPTRGDLIVAAVGEDVVGQMMDDLVGGILQMAGIKEAPARKPRPARLHVVGVAGADAEDGAEEGEE